MTELIIWWLPMVLVLATATILRLSFIGYDLPATSTLGGDEFLYFVWSNSVLESGHPNVASGTGYPPGYLYMWAGEQAVVEAIRGDPSESFLVYTFTARSINGLLGVGSVALIAALGRKIGKSRLAGLVSALFVSAGQLMVEESRRAAPTTPWVFFTLLVFVFLLMARDKKQLRYLSLAWLLGIISFLFKYSSGVILALPLIYAIAHFRHYKMSLYVHLLLWAAFILLVLVWLAVDYSVFDVVNTPGSDTGSFMADGKLIGLQSFNANFDIVSQAVGGRSYIWVGVIWFLFTLLIFAKNQTKYVVDTEAVAILFGFCVAFYFLMSFFRAADVRKWLIVAVLVQLLFAVALVSSTRLFGVLLDGAIGSGWGVHLVPLVGFVAFGMVFMRTSLHRWNETYRNVWSKPYTPNLLNEWFYEHVPQGGRVVSEVVKMPYNYPYAPIREVDPIVKTRKWGQLRWAGLSPAGNERRDEQAKRPVLLAFRRVTPS